MMSKVCAAANLAMAVWLAIGSVSYGEEPQKRSAEKAAKEYATEPLPAAFLYGESIQKKGAPQSYGINASRIDWWVVDPDGKNPRRLDDPKTARLRVRPIDCTVILKQTPTSLTLLGPDDRDLTFSLKRGPACSDGAKQSDLSPHDVFLYAGRQECRVRQ